MTEWVGKTLGRVRIDSLLARGGIAEVYLGTHTLLHRKVAVKILRNQYEDDPDLLQRFRREAVVVSRLRHPNIVQILDLDVIDGIPYIVMEYIAGPSLAAYLAAFHNKGRRVDLAIISRLLTSVAGALEYAHQMGIIHRDVKPGNILLNGATAPVIPGNTMPAGFQPVLTDFGLVRFLSSSRQTSIGQIAGTPAYMSPEQARGETTDERTDIYSLGIVLYEMLSGGHLPFDGETTTSILFKHVHEPPDPIPGLAPHLQAILDKALAKDRDDRFQTPLEFASAFEKAIEQRADVNTLPQLIPVRPTSRFDLKALARRRTAVIATILASIVGAFLWMNSLSKSSDPIILNTGGDALQPSPLPSAPPLQLGPTGVLHFQDEHSLVDGAVLLAQGMPLPPPGTHYEVWLKGITGRLSLGLLMLDNRGKGELKYKDRLGRNLVTNYDTVEVTIESNTGNDPEAPGRVAFAFTMPEQGMVHVRYLLSSAPDTPNRAPIINGLQTSIITTQRIAHEMISALEAGNEDEVRKLAESILNLLSGNQSTEHRDWDEDGTLIDPSYGYGLLLNGSQLGYIQAVYSEADYAANTQGATLNMIEHGEEVKICAQNLAAWAPQLRLNLLSILKSRSTTDMEPFAQDTLALADKLFDGFDLDSDGSIAINSGECGFNTILSSAYSMADMPLLPFSLQPTSTLAPTSIYTATVSPTPTKISVIVSPTRAAQDGGGVPAPQPQPTKKSGNSGNNPGGNPKPKPTKKGP